MDKLQLGERKQSRKGVEIGTLSHVQFFVTHWTVAHQGPLSMAFSRQEYWSDCHSLLQESSQPRNQTHISCVSCIAGRIFTAEPPEKPKSSLDYFIIPYFIIPSTV